MENPFRPAFGIAPPEIIGRDKQIDDFIKALHGGIGHPHRSTIFVGARGMGKTVLLNEVAKKSQMEGWISIQATVNPQMLDDMLDQFNAKANHLLKTGDIRLSGLSAAGFGVEFTSMDQEPIGWRHKAANKIEQLAQHGTGSLFLIDEAHANEPALKVFLTAYQHLLMEERKVAIALAGLPSAVSAILNADVITFLRRAHKEELHNIDIADVEQGMATTIEEYGKSINDASIKKAAAATGGYPFLIQMIGFQMWEESGGAVKISPDDVDRGILIAKEYLTRSVYETAISELSEGDRHFLIAMSKDDSASKISDIAARIGKNANYTGQYRKRLLETGIIEEKGYGLVNFSIPFMREYVREKLGE